MESSHVKLRTKTHVNNVSTSVTNGHRAVIIIFHTRHVLNSGYHIIDAGAVGAGIYTYGHDADAGSNPRAGFIIVNY